MKAPQEELLPIGRFARLSGLTVKALRHYGEIGLLEPAYVDEESGYRYYVLAQARRAEGIRRLRSLGLPLDEVREVLDAPAELLRDRLLSHRAHLEARAIELQAIVAELTLLIEGKEMLVPDAEEVTIPLDLHVEEVPEQRALVVTDRAHADDMSTVVPRQIEEVRAHLEDLGLASAGPPFCVCPFADQDGMLESKSGWPVAEDVPGSGRIESIVLPPTRALVMKHRGPYEDLSRSYRLMSEVMRRHGLRPAGDPREVYVTDPEEIPEPKDYETVIVWPIGSEGRLDPTRDRLEKRRDVKA